MKEMSFFSADKALQYLADITGKRIKIASDRIPANAPDEVKQVAKAWLENARKAAELQIKEDNETDEKEIEGIKAFWEKSLYVHEDKRKDQHAWIVGDNYDRGSNFIFYPESGEWYEMPSYGEESLLKGGLKEAIANAEIMHTG